MAVAIVVLNDGETYSNVEGCKIVVINDIDAEELECGRASVKDLTPLIEIDLEKYLAVLA